MKRITHTITLTNTTNNAIVRRIIERIGNTVILHERDYGNGVAHFVEMELTDGHTNDLMIANDNSWGSVTKVEILEGHIVLSANFGDDGVYCYSATIPECCVTLEGSVVNHLQSYKIGRMQTFEE